MVLRTFRSGPLFLCVPHWLTMISVDVPSEERRYSSLRYGAVGPAYLATNSRSTGPVLLGWKHPWEH